MTRPASSTSWCSTASQVRSSAAPTRSRPPRALRSSCSRSSWYRTRTEAGATPSADLPGDVVLGPAVGGVGEDLLGRVVLDQPSPAVLVGGVELDHQEGRAVGDAGRLLHVVGDDH